MSTDLPDVWTWAKIADVSDVQLGRQRSPQHHAGEQMRPYLRSANVTWQGICLANVNEMNFDDVDFEKYRLVAGDILLNEASGSPHEVGKPAIWNGEIEGCCFQNTLLRLRPQILNRDYLYWYCYASALTGRLGEAGRGVNIRHLGKRGLSQFPIPVAPLAEQSRIVAAIEEHFSRLDAVDASLTSVTRRVEMLEQAVIDQAMKGKRHRLGDRLSEPLRNGFSPPRSSDGNTRVLTLTAVTNRAFTENNTKIAVVPQAKRDQLTLQPGDILVQRSNTPELVGTAALYAGPSDWAVFPDLLIRVRPDQTLLPAYLELALRSSDVRRYFRLSAQGIAGSMPKISQSTIEELEVPIPASIAEQQTIVRRVSSEVKAAMEVQDYVSSACKRADSLRRAVLAAAFAGQLVPQDPYDEPTSVLLERIAASHTTKPKRQKVRA